MEARRLQRERPLEVGVQAHVCIRPVSGDVDGEVRVGRRIDEVRVDRGPRSPHIDAKVAARGRCASRVESEGEVDGSVWGHRACQRDAVSREGSFKFLFFD